MAECAGQHRRREVGDITSARSEAHIERENTALIVEADLPIEQKVVALAGDDHVVIARQAQLRRPPGLRGDKRRHAGDLRRLTLLAAEGTADAPHLDGHCGVGQVQKMRDAMLHLGRMLGRAINQHSAIAGAETSGQPMRRGGEGAGGIAALHSLQRRNVALGGERLLDGEDGRQRRVVDGDALGRLTRRREAVGRHDGDGLTGILRCACGKAGLALEDGADVVDPRDIGSAQHHRDAGQSQRGRGIDTQDAGTRMRAHDQFAMQKAGWLGYVVDETRGAGDMEPRAVMVPRRAWSAGDATGRSVAHSVITSSGTSERLVASQKRRSRLPAICVR